MENETTVRVGMENSVGEVVTTLSRAKHVEEIWRRPHPGSGVINGVELLVVLKDDESVNLRPPPYESRYVTIFFGGMMLTDFRKREAAIIRDGFICVYLKPKISKKTKLS
jgi:hypothetical protein